MKSAHISDRNTTRQLSGRALGLGIILISLALVGCSGGSSPTEPRMPIDVPTPTPPPAPNFQRAVSIVSGDGQTGRVGETLVEPLVARVTDEQGQALEGITVLWTLTKGDGHIPGPRITIDGQPGEATKSITDRDGLARVYLILGSTPGRHVVKANTIFSTGAVRFVARAN